jgi:hypothetical protein
MATQAQPVDVPAQSIDRTSQESRRDTVSRYDLGVFTRVFVASLVALAAARAVAQMGMV